MSRLLSIGREVEEGGVGAGTVHSFRMSAGGRTRVFRARVAEPDPGRVLTESDTRSSTVPTWVVTREGRGSRVRLETRWQVPAGLRAAVRAAGVAAAKRS